MNIHFMLFLVENLNGQLCNRLWSFVPPYTFAKKHGIRLNVLFENIEYVSLFPNANKDRNLRFIFTSPFWHKVRFMRMVTSFLNRQIHGELRCFVPNPFTLYSINGWEHRGDISFTDDSSIKSSLLHIFAFSDGIQQKVNAILEPFDGLTIGLHVRRGDYRQWKKGQYFYEDNVWSRIMHSITEQAVIRGKRCRFLIASNETWTYEDDKLEMFQIPEADGITDLCALSKCDYIVGPPSTYSQWASFMGNVPLHFILSPDEEINLNDFSPIVRQDVFANGKKLQWNSANSRFFMSPL